MYQPFCPVYQWSATQLTQDHHSARVVVFGRGLKQAAFLEILRASFH